MATSVMNFAWKLPRISATLRRLALSRGPCLQPPLHIHHQFVKSTYCTKTPAATQSWQLMSAVCLERYPIISNELDGIQRRYQDTIDQEEWEESYLSEHEIKVDQEMLLLAKKKKGLLDEEDDDATEVADTSVLEREDKAKAELKAFAPANRITDADKENNLQNLERKLDNRLILLVKCKLGDESMWMMPQGNWQEGESLKETAEKVLTSHCGSDNLKAKFVSGVPSGFYKFKYPKAVRKEGNKIGAKVFFFKARYIEGDFQLNDTMAEDYMWVTRDELDQYLNQSYAHKIKKFVLPTTIQVSAEDIEEEMPRVVGSKS